NDERCRMRPGPSAEVHRLKRRRESVFPNRAPGRGVQRCHHLFGFPGVPDTGWWTVHRVQPRAFADDARVAFAERSAPQSFWSGSWPVVGKPLYIAREVAARSAPTKPG